MDRSLEPEISDFKKKGDWRINCLSLCLIGHDRSVKDLAYVLWEDTE